MGILGTRISVKFALSVSPHHLCVYRDGHFPLLRSPNPKFIAFSLSKDLDPKGTLNFLSSAEEEGFRDQ